MPIRTKRVLNWYFINKSRTLRIRNFMLEYCFVSLLVLFNIKIIASLCFAVDPFHNFLSHSKTGSPLKNNLSHTLTISLSLQYPPPPSPWRSPSLSLFSSSLFLINYLFYTHILLHVASLSLSYSTAPLPHLPSTAGWYITQRFYHRRTILSLSVE